ncbi:MAG: phosphoribosylanthranilate isomerase [Phycisphaerae bacterium]|jgi:phosphoribosylanthranilate isomerase
MRVKICGITRRDDALLAARCGADFVGLIRAAGQRQVTPETARQILGELPPATAAVLVFRDAPLADVVDEAAAGPFGYVQLHGREPVSYAAELQAQLPNLRIIRAWSVAGVETADELCRYLEEAKQANVTFAAVLLDAPKGGPHPGFATLGEVSRRCHALAHEVWCAGGLTCENLATAVRAGDYTGVDVARGVETSPGVKAPQLVADFLTTARALP